MSFRNIYKTVNKDEEQLAKIAAAVKEHTENLRLAATTEEKQTRQDNAAKSFLEMSKWYYADSANLKKAGELLKDLENALTEHGYTLPREVQASKHFRIYNRDGWSTGLTLKRDDRDNDHEQTPRLK